MVKIAIVGSQGKHWTPTERIKVIKWIHSIFVEHQIHSLEGTLPFSRMILISGGCGGTSEEDKQKFDGGVDVWAEIVADVLGIEKDIKYAEVMRWEDFVMGNPAYIEKTLKGFKTRNLEIARECDVLYCIDPAWRKWSGGRWTMQEAEKLGKEVRLVLI